MHNTKQGIMQCRKTMVYLIPAAVLITGCATSSDQTAIAHANEAIADANSDPKIAAAIRDWNGPDRRFSVSDIQKLRIGFDSRSMVEEVLGPPTKVVFRDGDEIVNYQYRSKGASIWGNAVAPRLFEPSRDYTVRASITIRQGRLLEYWWSTDVFQLDVMRAVVGLKFDAVACRRLDHGVSIEHVIELVGEPSTRKWFSDGRQELGYLYGRDGKSDVANLRFVSGKLDAAEVISYPQ